MVAKPMGMKMRRQPRTTTNQRPSEACTGSQSSTLPSEKTKRGSYIEEEEQGLHFALRVLLAAKLDEVSELEIVEEKQRSAEYASRAERQRRHSQEQT